MLIIPKTPNFLTLSVGRLWNGERCPDSRLMALVEIQKNEEGILIRTTTPPLPGYRAPEAPPGTRIENLDPFERICVFFVEDGGQYLEVKLAVGGQYSVLGFEKPHEAIADFSDVRFKALHTISETGKTINEVVLPLDLFPSNLRALNAFFVVGNQTLAYHPIPGSEANFHQPDSFPFAKAEE